MENNKNKKSVKFQGDMLNFCDFIQVFVFTRNHHLNANLFPRHVRDLSRCLPFYRDTQLTGNMNARRLIGSCQIFAIALILHTVAILASLLIITKKADDKIFVCKFPKNVKSKLCHIEN